MAGEVKVAGQKAQKPGQLVEADAAIELTAKLRYVSRGGLKLEAALRQFGIDAGNAVCADFGSSTGGSRIAAAAWRGARLCVRRWHRATGLEAADGSARYCARGSECAIYSTFGSGRGGGPGGMRCQFHFGDIDSSGDDGSAQPAEALGVIVLIKPQFEAGRGKVGKGGLSETQRCGRQPVRNCGSRRGAGSEDGNYGEPDHRG